MSARKPGKSARGAASRSKAAAGRDTLRSVPPTSPRCGTNSKKEAEGKRALRRARRAGTVKKVFSTMRFLALTGLAVGGLGAGGWFGYQAFQRNAFLSLTQVDVVGNKLLDKAAILEKAGLELGVKLPSIPVKSIEASVRTLPGVGEVDVKRIFPSRIEIRVHEKEPVAMGFAKGWRGLSPDGTRISGLDWSQSDLPVVDGFAALDSLQRLALGRFLAAAKAEFPSLYGNFSQLTLHGDGLEIILRDGRFKVLVALETGSEAWRKALAASKAIAKTASTAPEPANPAALSPSLDSLIAEKMNTAMMNKSLNSLEFLQALMRRESASLEPAKVVDLRVEGFAYVR